MGRMLTHFGTFALGGSMTAGLMDAHSPAWIVMLCVGSLLLIIGCGISAEESP